MAQNVRFILLNTQEQFTLELRSTLLGIEGVKIVAEVDDPSLLAPAVGQFPVDAVLVNLDPNPDSILPIVADVASSNRNLPVFAVSESTDGPLILKVMRMGIREFFPRPLEVAALSEAVGRVSVSRVDSENAGKLITVIGTSGGVGATMITVNLAVELTTLASGSVTAVDLDYRFGQVATLLDITPTYTLADLCGSAEQLDPSIIKRALMEHSTGLTVLSRPASLAEADIITGASCMGVVSNLLQMSDYVVVDGPTRFDMGATSVCSLSDVNLLIVQLLVPCVRNATRILDSMRERGFNLDSTKLICNRTGRDAGHLSTENVAETLGLEVFASIPDDWPVVSAAINIGEPLLMSSPKSKVRVALQDIAQRLHNPDGQPDAQVAGKKGLLGRMFANS
ncbi:MAG: hypothetical protein IIB59_01500 [Planctomycetes bacterium]|nr:hypothetical protein [Planctomycetota bacterium]